MFPVDYERLKGVINWTMTYRRDSDIVVPYGQVTPKTGEWEMYSIKSMYMVVMF